MEKKPETKMEKKPNPDIIALQAILSDGTEKLSPLGHKKNCDSGKIDIALLKGVDSLGRIAARVGKSKSSKASRNSSKARAYRVKTHINWMAQTATSGSGVVKHLENVYGSDAKRIGSAISVHLKKIAEMFNREYTSKYGRSTNKAK